MPQEHPTTDEPVEGTQQTVSRSHWMKATGLAVAGLLALSACVGTDGDNGDDTDEPDVEDTDDDQDDIDDDDLDDGDEPDDDDDDETALGSGDAPAFSEIESDVWDSMRAAESVTIDGEGDGFDLGLEQVFGDEIEDDEEYFTYRGNIDGSAWEIVGGQGDASFSMLLFEDEALVSGEDFAAVVAATMPEELEEEMPEVIDDLEAELEGTWVDLSDEMAMESAGEAMTLETIFEDIQLDWEQESSDGIEGVSDNRDGEDVWVYTSSEGYELVVLADEENPYMMFFEGGDDDSYGSVVFTDWNQTEEPERPDDSDILTQEDLEDILLELMS